MKVTKACIADFRGYPSMQIPAGLRVKPVGTGNPGSYWLDEFPPDLFPRGSILLHDATYYGLWLTEEQVEERA